VTIMKKIFVFISLAFLCNMTIGQIVFKYNIISGVRFPNVKYKDKFSNTINYTTQTTLDQRIGMCFRPDTNSRFTFGLHTGLLDFKSKSINPSSEFELNALNFDLYIKYNLNYGLFKAVSAGTSVGITIDQVQTNNSQTVFNESFANSFIGLYGEIELGNFSNLHYAVNPFIYYRTILTNMEGTDLNSESTHISSVGFGLKITL